MRTAERLRSRATRPFLEFWVVASALAVFLLIPDTSAATNTQAKAVFPNSCRQDQRNNEKIAALWQALVDHPTAGAYNTLGVLYASADRVACAIPAFESALYLDPSNWESHYNLALALVRNGERIRATKELRSAIGQKPDSAAAHLALGSVLKASGEAAEAAEEFKHTLAIDPHESEASLALAQIATASGNYRAAIRTLEAALALRPPADQAEVLEVAVADAYAQTGDTHKGGDILRALIANQPNSADAHFALGIFEVTFGQPGSTEEALGEFREALHIDPKMDKARLSLGKILVSQKKYWVALPILREFVVHEPNNAQGFYVLALAYGGERQLSKALGALQHAANLDPKNADIRYELGDLLAEEGRVPEALTQLQMAAKLQPDRPEIHGLLADLFEKSGKKENANSEHSKYEGIKAAEAKAAAAGKLNQEANEFLAAGNPKAAVESYRKALQLIPSDPKLHYNLSLALDKMRDLATEKDELLKAVRLDSKLGVAQNQLGLLAMNSGHPTEAEVYFKKALAVNPEYAEAKNNLGVLYNREGKSDEAAKLFQAAIDDDPTYTKPSVNLGLLIAQRGASADAEQLLRSAIQADPNDADAFSALGMVQAKTGHKEDALKTFRHVVVLNPSSADAHVNLGIALVDQYDRLHGFEEFAEAARLDPNSAAAHYNLGRFYFETGKYGDAGNELERACKLQPNFANALYFLALTETQNGDLQSSTELLDKVVRLQPDNADAQYLLGQNLERAGKTTEAIEHWKTAVTADPNHSQALYNLARTLSKVRDPEAQNYQRRFDELQRSEQISDRVQQLGNFALEAANAQNWPQAMEQMSQAIELCGSCAQAAHLHRNLGLFYARTGNLESAEKELRKALELAPGDRDAESALTVLANARTAQAK